MTRRPRGFSAVEVLVALVIVSIVMVAAGALFGQIGRQADRQSGRSPGVGGMTDVALDGIVRDLRAAVWLPASSGGVNADSRTLFVQLGDGRLVTWHQEGNKLLREEAAEGEPVRVRKMLDGVLALELRRRDDVLFDIGLRRRDEPLRRRTVLLRNAGPGAGAAP